MHIARGPAKNDTYDEKKQGVDYVSPAALKKSIDSNGSFRFNITKEGYERQAVCTAQFSNLDLVEITKATANRLQFLQGAVDLIEKVNNSKQDNNYKAKSIKQICDSLKYSSKLPAIKLD